MLIAGGPPARPHLLEPADHAAAGRVERAAAGARDLPALARADARDGRGARAARATATRSPTTATLIDERFALHRRRAEKIHRLIAERPAHRLRDRAGAVGQHRRHAGVPDAVRGARPRGPAAERRARARGRAGRRERVRGRLGDRGLRDGLLEPRFAGQDVGARAVVARAVTSPDGVREGPVRRPRPDRAPNHRRRVGDPGRDANLGDLAGGFREASSRVRSPPSPGRMRSVRRRALLAARSTSCGGS